MKTQILILTFLIANTVYGQARLNKDSLTNILEEIYNSDQKLRLQIDSLQTKYGFSSPEVQNLFKEIHLVDSLNLLIVKNIIKTYGWISEEESSLKANKALFLVIQHADIETQITFLPILQTAVAEKKAKPADYAYLLDRVNMSQGKFQIYGTQLYGKQKGSLQLFPIHDEPKVNKRRKEIGLEPLEEYLRRFGQSYKLPETDAYLNKIIIMGQVLIPPSTTIPDVLIYWSNSSFITKTDSDGIFKIITDKSKQPWALIFRKSGFHDFAITIEDKNQDVYTVFYGLTPK